MAATMLGSLLVSLGLESGTFKSGLTDAERRMRRTSRAFEEQGRRIEAIGRSIGDGIRTLGAAAAGGGLLVLIDSFTKLQNNLRVAGLEGEALVEVQGKLFSSAQKYGVALEGLTGLYGKVAQSQKDLGASQLQILKITDLTSASLKITGVSAEQSAGAILGLSQAFASGIVRAEEFNQINEGGLRPLLQAVANTERFGGSIGKLREAIVDGKVSSQEFFRAILSGSAEIEAKAAKATGTLAQGVTQLTNAMTVYVGEASKASGVTAILTSALEGLAKNFATIANIGLTVVGVIGVRWVSGLVAATASTIALRAASLGLIASLGGITVAARVAGAALLAAFGGPVGVALLAVGAAIYYVTTRTDEAARATGAYAKAQSEATKITDGAAKTAEKLALAHGKARQEALTLARAEAENIKQKLASAKASVILAQAELARIRARNTAEIASTSRGPFGGGVTSIRDGKALTEASANAKAANETVASLTKSLATVTQAINAVNTPAVSAVKDAKTKKGPKTPKGPDTAEINRRFNDELAGYAQQVLSSRQAIAMSAEEAAEYERRGVELARTRTLDGIQAEKDYSAVQKQRLSQEVEALAQAERDRIDFGLRRELEDQRRDIDQQDYEASRDALQMRMDMADTEQQRQDIALQLLGLDQEFRRNALEQIIASDVRTDAEKQLAQQALDRLNANAALEVAATERQTETRAQAYLRDLNKTPEQINEAIDGIKIGALENFNDQLVDAIVNFKSLGSVAKNVIKSILAELLRLQIQQAIIKPLANALGLGGGSIPGFAGGTNFAPGGLALVGERGPELVNLKRGSQVIPNHELSGLGGMSVHKPTFVFPGVTNERMAREAAGQAARRYRSEINGPIRGMR